jgi:23S rRNA (pseudouridine1915-N3)-methyltransferase
MHKLLLLTVGKPQESWQSEAIQEYLTRLKPFAKVEVIELAEGHDRSAKPDEAKTRAKEAELMLARLPVDATVVAMDEVGKNLSSPEFAATLERLGENGRTIVFCVGGSWGLDATVKQRAHLTLSFGRETLPHMLARVVLLEQLYRAETIIHGKTYHK